MACNSAVGTTGPMLLPVNVAETAAAFASAGGTTAPTLLSLNVVAAAACDPGRCPSNVMASLVGAT